MKTKKFFAVVLTLISLGSGHFYVGMRKLGIGLALLNLSLFAVFFLVNNFTQALAALLLIAILWAAFFIHLLVKLWRSESIEFARKRYVFVFVVLTIWPNFIVVEYSNLETFSISSSSMHPGLAKGALLFAYRYQKSEPNYGDIVAYRTAKKEKEPSVRMHRVVGLPGDKVRMKDGALFINGKSLHSTCPPGETGENSPGQYCETFPNGKTIKLIDSISEGNKDTTPAYTVPEDHYFIMGDNRDRSIDSRFSEDVGSIPRLSITHKAVLAYYPEIRFIE